MKREPFTPPLTRKEAAVIDELVRKDMKKFNCAIRANTKRLMAEEIRKVWAPDED